MITRQQKLARAVNTLSRYFGVKTVSDLAARIALDELSNDSNPSPTNQGTQNQSGGVSGGQKDSQNSTALTFSEIEKRLIELLIDSSEGARTTYSLIKELNQQINLADNAERLKKDFGKLVQIHYADIGGEKMNFVESAEVGVVEQQETGNAEEPKEIKTEEVTINKILEYGNLDTRINQNPSNPTKEFPGLSIILSNSTRVSLESQNTAASTIFFNGIPNVELQRMVPYIDINLYLPKQPLSSDNRIQSLSLNKFLLGAAQVKENTVLETLTKANTTTGQEIAAVPAQGENPEDIVYSAAGMELFTTPQTLVNANSEDIPTSLRSNPVLDKFRPFLTINDLSISVEPSAGIMSFKRGSLSLILHDRSRLPEIANFVKPDLYGKNEIQIEYGWSHPDARSPTAENAYGDLLDGLRVKEKYMVVNSSFNFDNSGQMVIKLNLAMRGAASIDTELMSSDNKTFSNVIKEIQELQETIGNLREKVFPPGVGTTQREIRGKQILDAAQDAMSYPNLTSDLKSSLKQFQRAYKDSSNPNARELVEKIEEIFGDDARRRRRGESLLTKNTNGSPTKIQKLRNTIQDSVRTKVEKIQTSADPFVVEGDDLQRRLLNEKKLTGQEKRLLQKFDEEAFGVKIANQKPVSLAKLLLNFVGEPLANTGKYDDVQLIFYPFNDYAGRARTKNIGNFVVDIDYFANELARYRLNHIGRSGKMSLKEFMDFVTSTIIDDPAAPSYGLKDENGPLYEAFVDDDGRVKGTRPVDEAPTHQTRLQEVLRQVTPDGTFRMPQVEIYLEALPEVVGTEDGEDATIDNGRTILRLHVFDRLTSSYSTLGQLLSATRTEELQAVGRVSSDIVGNRGVAENRKKIAETVLASAEQTGLIEKIPKPNSRVGDVEAGPDTQYRIIGGPQKLKEFIMENTPYIIYGAAGTTVENAQLASLQDSALNTVNLIRSYRREENITPNGEDAGGLPMQIIPTQLSIDALGNPLLGYMQRYFVDFQTGTTADNFYSIIGVEHSFNQGNFKTQIKFAPDDSWGQYRSFIGVISNAIEVLRDVEKEQNENSVGNNPTGQSRSKK